MKNFFFSLILISLAGLSQAIADERMEISTDTLVIQKLERILETLNDSETLQKKNDLTVRLADLYSERARSRDMQINNEVPETEKASKDDREKALGYYKQALEKSEKSKKGGLLLQMAQLHELNGHPKKAQDIFKKITDSKGNIYDDLAKSEAYIGLGNNSFNHGDYKKAQVFFKKALALQTLKVDFINYRLAWCYFHEDKFQQATKSLISVLKTKEKLDHSFREEASHDLATFQSRGHVDTKTVQTLSDLSPENTRTDNLKFLATELGRLGKKESALLVLSMTVPEKAQTDSDDEPKSEIALHVQKAELQYDLGHKDLVSAEIAEATRQWKSDGCKAAECDALRLRLRKLITNWDRSEKTTPSTTLLQSYEHYVGTFTDAEMNYWAAIVAQKQKQWNISISHFRAAGEAKDNEKLVEVSLLGEIEVAEASKDAALRDQAYAHYLEQNPRGERALEIQYQRVHLLYEQGQYPEAANQFHKLALLSNSKGKSKIPKEGSLQEKAADLALDSLLLAKNEEAMESWAKEFSKVFKHRKTDFLRISRKAALNSVTRDTDGSHMRENLAKLRIINLDGASHEERANSFRNRLVLAEKLKDLPEVLRASQALLNEKPVSSDDKELALSRKAWVAELTLDFKTAFKITKELSMPQLTSGQKLLKIAILAELAGFDSDSYYERYLLESDDKALERETIAKLIRRSKHPQQVFEKYERRLRRQPELYSTLALEIFARFPNYDFLEQVSRKVFIQGTSAEGTLKRLAFLKRFESFYGSGIKGPSLSHASNKALKKSFSTRISKINDVERWAVDATRTGDWTLQLVTLTSVAKENRKFAREIESLPVPKGLNKKQKSSYRSLLADQAKPYRDKAERISSQISLLEKQDGFEQVLEEFKNTKAPVRSLVGKELILISRYSSSSGKKQIRDVLAHRESKPKAQTLEAARTSVKTSPFDLSRIEKLKILEEQAGNKPVFVAYLDARISKLKSGGGEIQ